MMMKSVIVWIILTIFLTVTNGNVEYIEPGQCISRFDYDHKVMKILTQLETQISNQQSEIAELRKRNTCSDAPLVAFMAQLSKNIVSPPTDTTVVFDTVHTNVGNGYKPGPGIFVAPVSGTYSFNLVATSSTKGSSDLLHLHMMHSTAKVGYIFLDQNSDRYLQRATTAVIELNAGDTVFVKFANSQPTGSQPTVNQQSTNRKSAALSIHISVDFLSNRSKSINCYAKRLCSYRDVFSR